MTAPRRGALCLSLPDSEPEPEIGPVVQGMMMLCDAAQAVGGKLYILGGAWSQLQRPPGISAANITVVVKLSVPWDLANHRMSLRLRLLTEDGDPVEGDQEPNIVWTKLEPKSVSACSLNSSSRRLCSARMTGSDVRFGAWLRRSPAHVVLD
jgi:hypothetical protein